MDLNNTETASLIQPRKTASINALINSNNLDHPVAKQYLEKYAEYEKNLAKNINQKIEKEEAKPKIVLPDLKPIDPDSLYEVFKAAYRFFNGKDFDEKANYGEGRVLAKTLILYFLQHKAFFKSPLLDKSQNKPDFNKGLLIFGGFGCGKTSIMHTFHKMFQYSFSHQVDVLDIEGTTQFLGRYQLSFGFYTTNEVVDHFEKISEKEEKDSFWRLHKFGLKYYDDLMTERTASNYGFVEIFKDILEKRCFSDAKTMCSLNYSGDSINSTLDAISVKYGERVYDRCFEMFNFIGLKGKSMRK